MNNAVYLDAKLYERVVKEAPKFLVITVSELCNKFKVNGAVARKIIRDLHTKNLIRQVGDHHSAFSVYSGLQAKAPGSAPDAPVKGQKKEWAPILKFDFFINKQAIERILLLISFVFEILYSSIKIFNENLN